MNHDTIDATPRRLNYSEGYAYDGGSEEAGTWTFWEAGACQGQRDGETCGEIVYNGGQCNKCAYEPQFEGPAMNYFYPLNEERMDENECARKLARLPLVLVRINGGDNNADQYGLALTGGGMDLTWEICAAYIALGYVPPAHFARNLPMYAGLKLTKHRREIIRWCRASLRCQRDWNARGLTRLRDTVDKMKGGR